MAMVSCPNGHWYDNGDHASCPYCNVASAAGNEVGATVPVGVGGGIGATIPVFSTPAPAAPAPSQSVGDFSADEGKTMPLIRGSIGIDPVVGWLICVEGKEKGKDFRIHADNNYVGRSTTMDICITGDETISRENHAIISYDSRDKVFYIAPGSGRAIIRHNNKPALMAVEIHAYDRIALGNTKLMFIPFCGEQFDWLDENPE
jgi:hypothetical protein